MDCSLGHCQWAKGLPGSHIAINRSGTHQAAIHMRVRPHHRLPDRNDGSGLCALGTQASPDAHVCTVHDCISHLCLVLDPFVKEHSKGDRCLCPIMEPHV